MLFDREEATFTAINESEARLMGLPEGQEELPLYEAPKAYQKLEERLYETSEALAAMCRFPAAMNAFFGYTGALAIRPELDDIADLQSIILKAFSGPPSETDTYLRGEGS